MSISYSFTIEEDLLHVLAWGADDDLAEVKSYGDAIIDTALANNCRFVLCQELELEYRLNVMDTYAAAAHAAQRAPGIVKKAIVCAERFAEDAAFWETVAVNRGLTVRFFRDETSARHWLGKEKRDASGDQGE